MLNVRFLVFPPGGKYRDSPSSGPSHAPAFAGDGECHLDESGAQVAAGVPAG